MQCPKKKRLAKKEKWSGLKGDDENKYEMQARPKLLPPSLLAVLSVAFLPPAASDMICFCSSKKDVTAVNAKSELFFSPPLCAVSCSRLSVAELPPPLHRVRGRLA